MSGSATIAIEIVSDASRATSGLNHTADAVDDVGRKAKTAGDRIEHMGSKSGQTTSGLRDMADAVGLLGFPQLAAGMGVAATGFEAIDGAATLFGAHSERLSKILNSKVITSLKSLSMAILTSPIFWIAVIIIAIGVAFVILYKKCDGFRKIVDTVFRFVKSVISGFWDLCKKIFGGLLDILKKPFELWLKIAKAIFDKGKDIVTGLVDTIKRVFSGVFDAIKKPFEKAINWVKDHFKMPSLPSWLPGVGKSAPGGQVFMPTARGAATRAVATGVGPTIVINAGIGDPHEIARQIRRVLRDDSARLGRLPAWSGAL
jgi:phage-related protein